MSAPDPIFTPTPNFSTPVSLGMSLTESHRRIWDTATGQCLRTLVHEDNPSASSVCFSPNGRFVLASYTDSCVRLWDFINMPCAVKKTYQGHVNEGYSIGGCFGVVRRRRPRVAHKLTQNGHIGQLDGEGEEQAVNGEEPEEAEQAEEEEYDDEGVPFVASASEDGDVVMWDVRTKEIVQRISRAHNGVCFWVDVHSASGTMVTCGYDKRIVVHRHKYMEPEPEPEDVRDRVGRGVNGAYPPVEDDAVADQTMEREAVFDRVNGENGLDHARDDLGDEGEGAEAAVDADVPMSE